ncbi:MAG: alpha/beta hydrolase [Rhodospirillaceae bacterium]|nr:alpha/beta hydrolase [Rhodospirillaceae bacterium]
MKRSITKSFTPISSFLLIVGLLASPSPTMAADGIKEDVVSITTADGVVLPALLVYPDAGLNTNGPAILHLHGGPGGSPIRVNSAARYAATGLAQAGYTNLSIETRHATRYSFTRFDEVIEDIRGGVDMLAARGFTEIILAGAGLGSLRVARYMVETDDPRVKAVVHYSPTQNMADNWRQRVGEDVYWATVDQAARAVEEGGRQPFIDLGDGLIFIPTSFLDWFGPQAKTSLSANIAGINRPMLMLAGEADPLVPKGRLEELQAVAFISPRVDIKYYPGVGRIFDGVRADMVADTLSWLTDIGLPPLPFVQTDVVDVVAPGGRTLSGILYSPATGEEKTKPVFMLMHGWTSDVMRSSTHWLGVRLAQAGYTAVAFQHRASGYRGVVTGKLEDIPPDIGAWVDFVAARGYSAVVGAGHGVGGLWWTYYLSETKDARIKGMVYLSPTRGMPLHARTGMGEDLYARAVLEAQEAVRDGEGATYLIDYPMPQAGYPDDPRQPMFLPPPGSGFTYYYADSFLSYWGPASKAVHLERISETNVPILALGGSQDPFAQSAYLITFTEAAAGPAKYVFYGGPNGAPYSFEGYENRVAKDVLTWIKQTLEK